MNWADVTRLAALVAVTSVLVMLGTLGLVAAERSVSPTRAGLCVALLLAPVWPVRRLRRAADRGRVLTARQTNAVIAAGAAQVIAAAMLSGVADETHAMGLWILLAAVVQPAWELAITLFVAIALTMGTIALEGRLDEFAGEQALFWVGLAGLTFGLLTTLRRQRAQDAEQTTLLRAHAHTDPLTGLANRRAFQEAAAREIVRADRTGERVALVFVDVDDFKSVNDRFGHLEGDRCLIAIATAIRSIGRMPDLCFRWGGDEFVMLLTDADAAGAREVVHRLRSAIAKQVRTPDGAPIEVSAAAAQLEPGANLADAIATADEAMLEMKRSAAAHREPGPRSKPRDR